MSGLELNIPIYKFTLKIITWLFRQSRKCWI